MLKVLVVGGFDEDNNEKAQQHRDLGEALGAALIEHDHVVLSGCKTKFDAVVLEAAYRSLDNSNEDESQKRIISYVLADQKPIGNFGTVLRSRLTDWEIGGEA